jgi:hypothetical protein
MLARMGFNDAAITALENLGLDHIGAYCDITKKDIPSMMKELRRNNVFVRQTSQNFLQALRYWVIQQEHLQVNYLPEQFTEELMRASLQPYQSTLETPSTDLIKSPDTFKEKTKWRDFSEAFTTFMQCTKGQCDFPLSYILRENEDDTDIIPDDFDTITTYEESIVPFSGIHFEMDNNAVFDSLKSHLLGGPHWTWIQDYEKKRDGRAAWKALVAHFEGTNNQIRLKAAAYAAIKRAEYKGAKNFDFELYRCIHMQAHSDLLRYGEPVPETKKVKHFLDGITEASLQPVKYTIAGFPNLMANFNEAANYIGLIIGLNKKHESITRQVSSTLTGRGRGREGRG